MQNSLRQQNTVKKARLQIEDCVDDYFSKNGIHRKFIVELALLRFLKTFGGVN